MKISGNTVLITGGATGIGFALASSFAKAGNRVLICGRREEKLREAKQKLPEIQTKKCDISKESERRELKEWVGSDFGGLNVLVNNAGIQRLVDFKKGTEDLMGEEDEIDTNLKAHIYLSAHLAPLLSEQPSSAVINISSGLGFVPLARYPVYSATKAALHSFSISLRHQLKDTPVRVFEIIFPTVKDTELKSKQKLGAPLAWGMTSAEAVAEAMKAIESDTYEAVVGDEAKRLVAGSKSDPEGAFANINSR